MKTPIRNLSCLSLYTFLFSSAIQAQQSGQRDTAYSNVSSAKIIVSQSYGEAQNVNLPFKGSMLKLLQYAGISEDSVNYNMIVTIDAKSQAKPKSNGKQGSGHDTTNNSGAILSGSVTFQSRINAGATYKELFRGNIQPSNAASDPNNGTANDAPFERAYNLILPRFLKSVYKPLGTAPLIAALKDSDLKFREAAAEALGMIKDTSAVGPLIDVMVNEKNIRFRVLAARALVNIKDSRAVGPMILTLRDLKGITLKPLDNLDPNWRNTDAAKNAVTVYIGQLQGENINGLTNLLDNINSNWRTTDAAKNTVTALITELNNENGKAKNAAVRALGEIRDSRALQPLIEGLLKVSQNSTNFNQKVLQEALTRIDSTWRNSGAAKKVISLVFTTLKDRNYRIPKSLDQLDPNWRTSVAARLSVPALIEALKVERNAGIPAAIANALKDITGQSFGPDYSKWNDWLGKNKFNLP